MSKSPFEVVEYSIDNLLGLFSSISETPLEDVEGKLHAIYFEEYFEEVGASTIVVEREYVDHDFLEDFAKYYVKCFAEYRRFCTRLHFYRSNFSEELFSSLFVGADSGLSFDELQQSYLGFMILKPIPETFVGRTCLKCYEPDGERRCYPVTRCYDANLFGLEHKVTSLAFQEQDTVVAACATSALWSTFHATGKLFQHSIPSPVEITEAAQIAYDMETRAFPNEGLTLSQMAQSIRSVSLEPRLINVHTEAHVLKGNVYAYLMGQIPLLLCIDLLDNAAIPGDEYFGSHAVAVTGFSLGESSAKPLNPSGLLLRATRINKIYVHDDQIGPFARMEFDGKKFLTSWRSPSSGNIGDVSAEPMEVLVPEYNKIRIPFDIVHDAIVPFDEFIESLRTKGFVPINQRIEWDIVLVQASKLKAEIRQDPSIGEQCKEQCLFESMPRFLWKARAWDGSSVVVDLLFDATDIPQGKFFLRAIEYNDLVSIVLRRVCRVTALIDVFRRDRAGRILEWFARQPI